VLTGTKYSQLAEQISAEIRSGRLGRGAAVPSIRKLMSTKNLSKATVIKGLGLLERDGLVVRHPQRGYFVAGSDDQAPRTDAGQVAYITPALSGDTQPLTRGISSALELGGGHTLATFSTHGNLQQYQRLIDRVITLQPAGLILEVVRPNLCRLDPEPLERAGVPLVLLGHAIEGLTVDRISEGKAAAAKRLVRYALDAGYRRPAVIACGIDELTPADSLSWEVVRELRNAKIDVPPDTLLTLPGLRGYGRHPDPYTEAEELVGERLAKGHKHDLIICDHDYPAVGAVRAIQKLGLRVKDDVAVISGLRCAVEGAGAPKLTTFDHHRDIEGQLAAEQLLHRIEGSDRQPSVHHLSATLVEGETA
jgi:DNA-binding LacI/PurR family transcriptional regulator